MSLITTVKMGEVNNLSDARFAAGFDVEFIGFPLSDDHPRKVDPQDVKEMGEWIEGPYFLAELLQESPPYINELLKEIDAQWLQVEQDYQYDLAEISGNVFQRIVPEQLSKEDAGIATMEKNFKKVEYFQLELGNFEEAIWDDQNQVDFLADLCATYNVFLDYPFKPANVHDIIEKVNPAGINIKGGDEVKPGYRDFDELIDLLEAIENE